MIRIIENPAETLDEAFAFVRAEVIGAMPPGVPVEAANLFLDWAEVIHRCGVLWSAVVVRAELTQPGDKRAPCVAVEKIIAQACPPKTPDGASN